jgi:hypothetical protein
MKRFVERFVECFVERFVERFVAIPCVVSFMLVACDGKGGRQIAIEDFHGEFLNASCAYLVRCGAAPDEATCASAFDIFATSADTATLLGDVQAHKTGYDPVLAGACLDLYATLPCGGAGAENDTCQKVFTGELAAGAACVVDSECVTARCTPTESTCVAECCAGTCAPATAAVPIGGACTSNTDVCVAGSACNLDHVCAVPSSTLGAPCATISNCVAPLVCEPTTGCIRPAAPGATCDPLQSYGCLDPLTEYCDPTTRTCTPRGKIADACVVLNATLGLSSCLTDATCDATSQKCVSFGALGASCAATGGVTCLGFLMCDPTSRTCVARPAAMACQ